MTDTITTTRLTATLEPAPASVSRWAISKLRTFRGLDGEGYEATVTLDGKVAGTIEDDGHGGGSWFRHSSVEARQAMEALTLEWANVNPRLAMPTSTVTVNDDGTRSQSEAVPMVSEEHIAVSLVENERTARRLNSAVKRGKTPVMTREQHAAADDGGEWGIEFGLKEYGTVNSALTAGLIGWATERDMLVWTSNGWVEAKSL